MDMRARTTDPSHDRGQGAVTPGGTDLAQAARPLLELIERLTRMETAFVTRIDWPDLMQEIVVAHNSTPELTVAEGARVPWEDSMCRRVFLSGSEQSTDVPCDFPDSIGARVVGMHSFFALPILDAEDTVLGTVCGASRRSMPLDGETVERLRLIAAALATLMRADVNLRGARARADDAELECQAAHAQAADVARTVQQLETLALTDPLTGLPNPTRVRGAVGAGAGPIRTPRSCDRRPPSGPRRLQADQRHPWTSRRRPRARRRRGDPAPGVARRGLRRQDGR